MKGGASDEEAEELDDGVDVCFGVEELNKCLPNSEDEENPPIEAAENNKVKVYYSIFCEAFLYLRNILCEK